MLVKRLIDGEFMIVPYSSLIIFFSSAQLSSSRDFRVVVELNKQRILTIIIRLYTILSQWAKSVKKVSVDSIASGERYAYFQKDNQKTMKI